VDKEGKKAHEEQREGEAEDGVSLQAGAGGTISHSNLLESESRHLN
jgi:hypothetical protein